jgi:hypothetical protein
VVDRVAAVLPDAVARLRLLDVPARGARP